MRRDFVLAQRAEPTPQKTKRDNTSAVYSATCHAKFTKDSPLLMLAGVKALSQRPQRPTRSAEERALRLREKMPRVNLQLYRSSTTRAIIIKSLPCLSRIVAACTGEIAWQCFFYFLFFANLVHDSDEA
ncbi:unnamed protein product [Amoebophrya sp. A120]|nr:unnamed protein product [Amoebophrya sp. A120]|eukprot:GSA120T00020579001.1